MFNRILVPLDGSSLAECVLPHVITMARATGAEVTLLRAIEQNHKSEPVPSIDPLDWHLYKAEAQAYLDGVNSRLQATGLFAKSVLLEGNAAERIVEFVQEADIDLIILSSHGRSGLSGWNISSVVQKVILRAYTSVLIIPAYQATHSPLVDTELTYRRILAPLDGSQRAECILPVLSSGLSQAPDSELLLLHVVARPEMPRRTPLTAEDRELAERLVERNYDEMSKYLTQLKSRLPGNVQIDIRTSDNVIATLHNIVEEEAVDLVLLSAHGYTGENKHPYGSVVTSFIAYGTKPLLIVQDLQPDAIEQSKAEVVASWIGSTNGVSDRFTTAGWPTNANGRS